MGIVALELSFVREIGNLGDFSAERSDVGSLR